MLRRDLKPTRTTFGRRLREARVRAGLTQDGLGVAIGLDEGNACVRIGRYESGVHAPTFDTVVALAEALAVPSAYLLTTDDRLASMILELGRLNEAQLSQVESLIDDLLYVDD